MFELIPGFANFLIWEARSKDTIDFKKVYVDMAGDLISGLMLSQIVFWYLPDKEGKNKLRVEKHGEYWIAKTREQWWDEIRLAPREVDAALKQLKAAGLIETRIMRFAGLATTHIRLLPQEFMDALNSVVKDGKERSRFHFHREGRRGKKIVPQLQMYETGRNHTSDKADSHTYDSNGILDLETRSLTFEDSLTETPSEITQRELHTCFASLSEEEKDRWRRLEEPSVRLQHHLDPNRPVNRRILDAAAQKRYERETKS